MNKVQVYYNLHKKVFSIKDKKTQRVIRHAKSILLRDAKFIVREGGRQRVLKEKRKNVHAFVEGYPVNLTISKDNCQKVWYNPYKTNSFMLGNEPIKTAPFVWLENREVFVE